MRRTGVAEALEPMSPSDRKVVHDTINELEGLETSSEGLEPRRYVVIRPASSPPNEQSPDQLDGTSRRPIRRSRRLELTRRKTARPHRPLNQSERGVMARSEAVERLERVLTERGTGHLSATCL